MNYVWFRWRDKWCHSLGDWRYFEMDVPKEHRSKAAKEQYAIDEISAAGSMDGHEVNTWSDKYRGFEVEVIKPTSELLDQEIKTLNARMVYIKDTLDRYCDLRMKMKSKAK